MKYRAIGQIMTWKRWQIFINSRATVSKMVGFTSYRKNILVLNDGRILFLIADLNDFRGLALHDYQIVCDISRMDQVMDIADLATSMEPSQKYLRELANKARRL